jgi:predicted Fe-Mo cluster-binding NifX family protein
MKIIITARGKALDAEVDPRFGRAQYFILYDTDDRSFSVLDNENNLGSPQGVGVQAGQQMANAGASAVLTGNCGPKAFQVLDSAGIRVFTGARGTVQETIDAFEAGKLAQADSANVQGHWS